MALEQTGVYRGLYHVLLGRIAPLEGIGPDQLTIEGLVRRVRAGGFRRADHGHQSYRGGRRHGAVHFQSIGRFPHPDHRLARGITSGSVLEFANKEILSDAMAGRQKF